MPFRDEDWEEWQRDCDIFPAYSDYLLGPDLRLVVAQEPGLHPLIYPTPILQPIQDTRNVRSRSQICRPMTRSGLATDTLTRRQSALHRGAFDDCLGNDSSNQTRALIDQPSFLRHPRTLSEIHEQSRQQLHTLIQTQSHSAAVLEQSCIPFSSEQASRVDMLQPNDIVHDPRYQCIQPETRNQIRRYLSGLWHIAKNSTDTGKKAKALADIHNFSTRVLERVKSTKANKGQHSPPHTPARNKPEQNDQRLRPTSTQLLHQQSVQSQAQVVEDNHPSQLEPQLAWQPPALPHTEIVAPQASAQLRVSINRYVPQVWYCLRITRNKFEPISADDLHRRNRAQQWLTSFKMTLPVEGRTYISGVLRWMYSEQAAGRDPLVSIGYQT